MRPEPTKAYIATKEEYAEARGKEYVGINWNQQGIDKRKKCEETPLPRNGLSSV